MIAAARRGEFPSTGPLDNMLPTGMGDLRDYWVVETASPTARPTLVLTLHYVTSMTDNAAGDAIGEEFASLQVSEVISRVLAAAFDEHGI